MRYLPKMRRLFSKPVSETRPPAAFQSPPPVSQPSAPSRVPIVFQVGDRSLSYTLSAEAADWMERRGVPRTPSGFAVEISPEDCLLVPKKKVYLCCVFNAVSDHLSTYHRLRLSSADRSWFECHPLGDGNGIPYANTLTVVEDLAKPYGMGISEIFVRRGLVPSDELSEWQRVLGCNPLALSDPCATDESFVAAMGLDRETADPLVKSWGYRIVDAAPAGAIVFYESGGAYARGGGHAHSCAPRERSPRFSMACRLDRLERCIRLVEPPSFGDYEPELEVSELFTFAEMAGERKSLFQWKTFWKSLDLSARHSPSWMPGGFRGGRL